MQKYVLILALFWLTRATDLHAQHEHPAEPAETHQHEMLQGGATLAERFFMHQPSGTLVNPTAAPVHMVGKRFGTWDLTYHALAHFNVMQQTGPRGEDEVYSTNWFMVNAQRNWGAGTLLFRTMISLDPATVPNRRYPLLFQTGETAYGEPLIDAQHPHDLFMELSAQYALEINDATILDFYYAPHGDPSIGPVAFPHRISAAELPQATLSHHLQDSTHIATNVITVAFVRNLFRMEASGFHGAEPDEGRWNINTGAINSWSTRFTLTPNPNVAAQVSIARLEEPEELEEGDIFRSTASLTYFQPRSDGMWTTSFIWGRNHKYEEDRNLNSYLIESLYQFGHKNYISGRVEVVDKDELFGHGHDEDEEEGELAATFRVSSFTIGYTRDFDLWPGVRSGVGGNFTFYSFPEALKPFYGDRPVGFLFYIRFTTGHGDSAHASH